MSMCPGCLEPEEFRRRVWPAVMGGFEPLCSFWELNLGFFAKATSAPNCWTVSPAFKCVLIVGNWLITIRNECGGSQENDHTIQSKIASAGGCWAFYLVMERARQRSPTGHLFLNAQGILFLVLGPQGSAFLSHVICKNKPKTLSSGAIVR